MSKLLGEVTIVVCYPLEMKNYPEGTTPEQAVQMDLDNDAIELKEGNVSIRVIGTD